VTAHPAKWTSRTKPTQRITVLLPTNTATRRQRRVPTARLGSHRSTAARWSCETYGAECSRCGKHSVPICPKRATPLSRSAFTPASCASRTDTLDFTVGAQLLAKPSAGSGRSIRQQSDGRLCQRRQIRQCPTSAVTAPNPADRSHLQPFSSRLAGSDGGIPLPSLSSHRESHLEHHARALLCDTQPSAARACQVIEVCPLEASRFLRPHLANRPGTSAW